MKIVVSLDIGTSKIAAIAFDADARRIVGVFSADHPASVHGLSGGRHEQSPEIIVETCVTLIRQLMKSNVCEPDAVKTVAITGQMHGLLLVDRELRALTNLITWCDQRAADFVASLDRQTWPADRTGCYLHAGYGAATLVMLKRAGAMAPGVRALPIASYVAARLCGIAAIDASHAASWGILDVRHSCWDRGLVDRLGIPWEILPDIQSSMSELGPLTLDLGLPKQVSVRMPLGDNQASFIGACGVGHAAMLLNLGTGGQISLPIPAFAVYPDLETRPFPFGGYLLVGASLCGGRSYAILKNFFSQTVQAFTGRTLGDDELYATMDLLSRASDRELGVDTRLAGTRMNPAIRGKITGIGIDSLTPAALCRGFTRGMVMELAALIDPEIRTRYDRIMVSGNGIRKNPMAKSFVTEAFGRPCLESANREEAATGAALAAIQAAGGLGDSEQARRSGRFAD